ncbi:hypothetical protein U14_05373 [Candidatus Moduliflexus flocculans]|uniref:Uncharacterized protein n=1 Tax=Candidatus Moduliflexus flocculans TaxID=1499966 RepID=A0A081BRR5_9BACT|nr:hypothetical protein U14_05373 [Candidatus Moduliflexus flocculans]
METIEIKKTDLLQMQQSILSLEMQLRAIQKTLLRYVTSDNEDLRAIAKQILTKNSEQPTQATFIPEISEGDSSISPVLLAGKWSDLQINAKQLRRDAWKEY